MTRFPCAKTPFVAVMAFLLAAPALGAPAERCAPVETVPGVKIRPANCPPKAPPPFRDAKQEDRARMGGLPGFATFGDTQVKIGGRVRVEGGYVQP